jgi:hypothetical protein
MSIGKTHNQRRGLAARAGAIVAMLLVVIAALTIWPRIARHPESDFYLDFVPFCICLGGMSAVLGAVVGIAGGARRFAFHVTAVGSTILAILAGIAPLLLGSAQEAAETRQEAIEQTWAFAAVFAFISMTSFAGAVVTGKKSDDGQTRIQFSLGEILLAFIPFAVFMGFLGHFSQK